MNKPKEGPQNFEDVLSRLESNKEGILALFSSDSGTGGVPAIEMKLGDGARLFLSVSDGAPVMKLKEDHEKDWVDLKASKEGIDDFLEAIRYTFYSIDSLNSVEEFAQAMAQNLPVDASGEYPDVRKIEGYEHFVLKYKSQTKNPLVMAYEKVMDVLR